MFRSLLRGLFGVHGALQEARAPVSEQPDPTQSMSFAERVAIIDQKGPLVAELLRERLEIVPNGVGVGYRGESVETHFVVSVSNKDEARAIKEAGKVLSDLAAIVAPLPLWVEHAEMELL